jgi:fatty-acyl-CoA synthase
MLGLMQDWPLLLHRIVDHAAIQFAEQEIVTRSVEGPIHRSTYRDLRGRSLRVAKRLAADGIKLGDRIGTLAWNSARHLETWYGISGIGAIFHTVNPRLFPEQIAWIVNHADDQVMFFDLTFVPIIEAIASLCPGVKHWVLMSDHAHLPDTQKIAGLKCYEDLLLASSSELAWPEFDENTASSLCYTSGTTGNPKGVLYSHRSTVLHSFASAMPDALQLSARDCVLPVVPMFHVNAWGLPYSTAMVGCKLVLPGPGLDGKSLYDLFESEKVTLSAGVPTVWLGLLNYVRQNNLRFSSMTRTVIGGSACPPAMLRSFQDDYGVQVLHAWGMTEMSPIGTCGVLKAKHDTMTKEERYAIQSKQGRAIYGVELKIVDETGASLPWDGDAFGDLLVRGPWVVNRYFKDEGGDVLRDGWFPTGDVATIDADGFVHITDRSKDVIKSGGEWIGSIDLENIAMSHPAVAMAAVIAVRHPKWDERPLLVVVKKPDVAVAREDLIAHYEGKIAKWWTPDDVVFVDAIPLGATGKMLKNRLREQFKDYVLPSAA